jgi:hypothetical protein
MKVDRQTLSVQGISPIKLVLVSAKMLPFSITQEI